MRYSLLLLLLSSFLLAKEPVFNQVCLQIDGHEHALLRTFSASKNYLLVNTYTLKTSLVSFKQALGLSPCRQDSPYQELRRAVLDQPKRGVNRGIKEGKKDAYVITVDMCPSSKRGFELEFFKHLIASEEGSPVSISMTRKWALSHRREFELLKAWEDGGKLDITWMNHGARHPYRRNVPIEKNFINLEGVEFTKEVLENEAFLIKEGRVPSLFYRFAGLVSNDRDFNYLVRELGLIPVGTLAWLAKGETIREGSLVLVHGNRNEPLGIRRLLKSKTTLPVMGLTEMFAPDKSSEAAPFIFLKTPL